ncbi:MAG: RNA-binding S4 domain-containing protein [Bacteroidetes bacterium]|uniref:RNA-binding S4 domain-containing protein n=1 Tax=Candidatus Cryptobacteroides excrementipullorum TaxID=2840761 RepID=A0A9D9ISJ8_9BACT|nr:RNA-binding S4 domain-containing protein [Candidatus Cryptobacteroides excrementipullorum]
MAEETRIDKYLWAIRVFKTRGDATDACKGGKIRINGADIKPSKAVRPGDVITVRKGAITFTYRVLATVDKRQGAKLVPQYAENITPEEELAKLKAPVETFFLKRDRGTGRPTKKERRQMESLWDNLDFNDLPADVSDMLSSGLGYEEDDEDEDYDGQE